MKRSQTTEKLKNKKLKKPRKLKGNKKPETNKNK